LSVFGGTVYTNKLLASRASDSGIPYWINSGGSTQAFYGVWNFTPSSYLTYSEYTTYRTNALKLYAGSVTQNQITARNEAWFSGTNLWIGLGGTNNLRFGGVLNNYAY